jgi:tRNA(Ile)-lysidine synthase
VPVSDLLKGEWLAKLRHYERLYVGFSGGLDSKVLLHVLSQYPELKAKLHAIHINHGVQDKAYDWAKLCQDYCKKQQIPISIENLHFDSLQNFEKRARNERIDVFKSYLKKGDCLMTGHHQDDQAETLLLQLLRGAGIDGLACMPNEKPLGKGALLRPFLTQEKNELFDYAKKHKLDWIEDPSNEQTSYTRNLIRAKIMPIIAKHFPHASKKLAQTAKKMGQAQQCLTDMAQIDANDCIDAKLCLMLEPFTNLSKPRQVNVLRHWIKQHGLLMPQAQIVSRFFKEVVNARVDANPIVSFYGHQMRRYQAKCYLVKEIHHDNLAKSTWHDFPNDLALPEGLGVLKVASSQSGLKVPNGACICVGFRKGGETIKLNGMTKSLKTLMQTLQIPPWQRNFVPLLFIDERLACLIGHVIADDFLGKGYSCHQISQSHHL